ANKMSMSMDCLGCAAKSSRGLAVRQLVACNLYPTPEQKSISNWPVSHADLFGRPLPRGMSGGPLLQFTKLTSTRSQRLLQKQPSPTMRPCHGSWRHSAFAHPDRPCIQAPRSRWHSVTIASNLRVVRKFLGCAFD